MSLWEAKIGPLHWGMSNLRAKLPHPWDLSVEEAKTLQSKLSAKVVERDELPSEIRTVAGVDVHRVGGGLYQAVVCVMSFPSLSLLEVARAEREISFPYIPGLLAFREGPVALEALEKVKVEPDLALFDAHGRSHPRRFGLACHMGVVLDLPAIGCAKSKLYGYYEEPPDEEGASSPLLDPVDDAVLGMAVRTKRGSAPIFVSVGHKVSLETAVRIALQCVREQRIPEPARVAHNYARERPKKKEPEKPQQKALF